jgi:hypothetical protein
MKENGGDRPQLHYQPKYFMKRQHEAKFSLEVDQH